MRNRVTTKIVLTTGLSLFVVTLALVAIVWEWQTAQATRITTDYSQQVMSAVAHADPAILTRSPQSLHRVVLDALPSEIQPIAISLKDPAGRDLQRWHEDRRRMDDSDQDSSDDALYAIANSLCALPDNLTVQTDLSQAAGAAPARFTAVLDLSEEKRTDADLIAQILQIFAPIAMACLTLVCLGVRQWVQRPAEAIIRVAHRIAAGDQHLRLAVTTKDEFGTIMRAFNELTDALLTKQQQADTDGLTQVFNHRYLQEEIGRSLAAAAKARRPMAILLIDLNKFKLLNDTYGHLVGDRYLQQTAAVLRRAVHLDGVLGRYGGDEFLIVLPHAGEERAQQAAERIYELMAAEQFRPAADAPPLPILFSMGIAVFPENGRTAQELIAYADAGLYMQKQGGENLVELTRDIEAEFALKFADTANKAQPGGLFATLFSLVAAVDNKDSYTKRHSVHVAHWAVLLGQEAGLPTQTLRALQVAGLLHDVGKIGVPDAILRKPGALSEQEQEIMAGHVALSERLIQDVPYQDEVLAAVSCHHERWDGQGYPRRLRGEDTPVSGRIMALVDAYSAMCLERPYRRAMEIEDICAELRQGAGSQFDADLVEMFVRLLQSHEPSELLPDLEAQAHACVDLSQSARKRIRKLPDAA